MTDTHLSLLFRAGANDAKAWTRLVAIYQPLIRGWLVGQGVSVQEADDLTQDVLAILLEELPEFDHGGRTGSFRAWLRTITANRARQFWRAGKCRPPAEGGSDFLQALAGLEDSASELSQQWDAEHDQHVYRRLLAFLEQEFEPTTVQVFRRLVVDEARPSDVAAEVGLSPAAVYAAKSRVLRRLREEAAGLLD